MGLWSKVAGWGMMIGGVALAVPTGGASLGLVGAGTAVLAADEQKEAAKKAEKQLETASNKAIGTLTQAKNESAQAFKPYTQAAPRPEMSALGNFMGLGSTYGQIGAGPQGGEMPVGALPAGTQQALGVRTSGVPTGTTAVARNPGATPQTQAAQASASSYAPTLGGMAGGGLVQMRAPTGQVKWVPREQAARYTQAGAVEVS
jgi:hypothetical protein